MQNGHKSSDRSPSLEDGTSRHGYHGHNRKGPGLVAAWSVRLRVLFLDPANIRALSYGVMNIVSASGIVFANKAVFTTHGYHFTFALTWIHTVFTLAGMQLFVRLNLFPAKRLPLISIGPLAGAFVAYIVLCNLSLKFNTVGFYQVMKIAVAPSVLLLELIMFGTLPQPRITAAVLVVCLGVAIATITDTHMVRNTSGIVIGLAATVMTALYQIWAGTKQRELKASSMQLLHAYTPYAALLLGILVPLCEPMGWQGAQPGTLLGYHYTLSAVTAIIISAVLGLLVSLSTFLVIGATSSLTYNVVGHLKTVIILTGGCLFFGDEMPLKKLAGVTLAMVGIIWYTQLKLAPMSAGGLSSSSSPAPLPIFTKGRSSTPVPLDNLPSHSVYTLGSVSARRVVATEGPGPHALVGNAGATAPVPG